MSLNFGGKEEKSGGTTTVALPSPNANESEYQALALSQLKKSIAKDEEYDASPLAATQKQINEKASANILARLNGTSPVLSPEQSARLDTIYGNAKTRGQEDLMRFARDMASARGMSVADSPVGDASLQEDRKFVQGLEASRAGAELDLGNADSLFQQQLQQFQQNLQQQAFQNRLMMSGQAGSMGNSLFTQRLAAAPRTSSGNTTGSNWSTGFNGAQTASGVGSMGQAGLFG